MIRTRSLCPHEACVFAVSALDDLVAQLVKACHLKLPPVFLDWVADEATPLIEQQVADCFDHPEFAASLRQGDPRLVLASWMRQWIRPGIAARFAELLPHLPPADPRLPVLLPAAAAVVPFTPAAVILPPPRARMPAGFALPA
jgi:hypothetical protein